MSEFKRDITERHSLGAPLSAEAQLAEDNLIVDTLHRVRVNAALFHNKPIEKRDIAADLTVLIRRFEIIGTLMTDPYGPEEGFDNGSIF